MKREVPYHLLLLQTLLFLPLVGSESQGGSNATGTKSC